MKKFDKATEARRAARECSHPGAETVFAIIVTGLLVLIIVMLTQAICEGRKR